MCPPVEEDGIPNNVNGHSNGTSNGVANGNRCRELV
jgi:hypothetical protein